MMTTGDGVCPVMGEDVSRPEPKWAFRVSQPGLGAGRGVLAAFLIMAFGLAATAQEFDHNHAAFDTVLKANVSAGQVDYRALKAAPAALNGYLDTLAAVRESEFKAWSEPRQLAFYFNLYNAATLKLIVDHYPVDSIKDIGNIFSGPWDQKVVRLFGETITLNNLEHDILRKDFNEPRLHMALVCAAKGCPPLRNEAYVGKRLDAQLDDQSRVYLTGSFGLQIDRPKGEARISSIFKWYGKDFPSVRAFVEKHSDQSLMGLKIRYLDYDWSLNGKG
jgi:hypothetical protein